MKLRLGSTNAALPPGFDTLKIGLAAHMLAAGGPRAAPTKDFIDGTHPQPVISADSLDDFNGEDN